MTLVLTTNALGQPRGEPLRLAHRRRRLSTVVARHRLPPGRRFIVSVHRRGEPGEIYLPNDRTARPKSVWSKTLVGPQDVVVITTTPMGKGVASIGLAIASIALIALAPYAAPLLAGSALFGAGAAAGGLTTAIQAGLVIGGVALGYAAQASKAAGKKTGPESYSISGGGNVPKPGTRKPLLYGRSWTSPPLSQPDYFTIDGDANVLTKRMTLGLGKYQIHRIRVGDALFWDEGSGIQAPFSAATGPQGAAVEFLYEQPSAIVPGDIVPSPSVGGQEVPRPGGNPERTPWYRLAPQGVSVDAAQMNWTYPAIYRISSSGKNAGAPAGVVFFGREIHPNTGAVIGPEFEMWRSQEPANAYIRTPLRRNAYFRLPKSGAYEVSAQNAYPEPLAGVEIENRVVWDAMFGFEDDTRIRPQTTEIVLRMRAGKGLTVTSYSDITVEATRILPVWTGSAWVEQPARKAVWAYCDLVRSGYGLAAPAGVDADKAKYYADLLTANDTFDGQLPEVSSFWEAASEVLQPLRADPVKVGAVHSFVRDESRAEPRHVLTRRQIVRDSGGATFRTKVEGGDVIVEFNRDGDPKRPDEARFSYGPPSRTPKRYRVNGITDGLHALKHATWLAAVAVFRGAERKITTEWDGRLVYPGDHVLSDLWFLKGKQAYGVAARAGSVLTLDVTANVATEWGYGSIRTRAGREWGILRMRGVGARGLELHPDDVIALEVQTGLLLSAVLTRDTQDPTTVVLGELVELQETYVARSAIPSDADHVQIEMVADDARVWQLLDEQVIAPAPVNADALAEPLVPQISVLHARCVRIETGIELVWGVSVTRGARNYEADLSYDGGGTWETLSPFGPESSGRAPMRQSDGPVTVRARAYGRTGLPGDWVATTFTTVAPVVEGRLVDVASLPLLTYANLDTAIRHQLDLVDTAIARATQIEADAAARAAGIRNALALDPAIRTKTIDSMLSSVRADLDILTSVIARNGADFAKMRDVLTTAGLEVIPGEGRVRIYALDRMQTEVSQRFTSLGITVDALKGQIELYGSVQTGDLSGIVTDITSVKTQLDAIRATITNTASLASFNGLKALVSTVEQTLDAQAGVIAQKARIVDLNANTVRLSSAEQSIDAINGSIGGVVAASRGSIADAGLLNYTLAGLQEFLARKTGDLDQSFAFARQTLSARIDDTGNATASLRTELGAFKDTSSATFAQIFNAIATGDSATSSAQQVLTARVAVAEGSIVNEALVRANADSVFSSAFTEVRANIAGAVASVASESQARVTADQVFSSAFQTVNATLGNNSASITGLQSALANTNEVFSGAFVTTRAQIGANQAAIVAETQARVNDSGVFSSAFQSVTARMNGLDAGLLNETNARVGTDGAFAAQNQDLYARSDRGTAFGRFAMTATSAPSGVTARVSAQVSTTTNGSLRNAGWSIDLMPDGTSRFIVDANFFALTANGGVTYPFQFDGNTLTIPSLVVTKSAILPGYASQPARFDAANYTLVSGAGVNNSALDSNMVVNISVENGIFPTLIQLYGKLSITGNGSLTSPIMEVDGADVGQFLFRGGATTSIGVTTGLPFTCTAVLFLSPGNHTVRFRYSYNGGGNAGSSVVINEIHLAAVTQRA